MDGLEEVKKRYAEEKGWTEWDKTHFYNDGIVTDIAQRYAIGLINERLDKALKKAQWGESILKIQDYIASLKI